MTPHTMMTLINQTKMSEDDLKKLRTFIDNKLLNSKLKDLVSEKTFNELCNVNLGTIVSINKTFRKDVKAATSIKIVEELENAGITFAD